MTSLAWFLAGTVMGALLLAGGQKLRTPKPSFDDLKIAVAPAAPPPPVSTPRATRAVSMASPPPAGRGSGKVTVTSFASQSRPRAATVPAAAPPAPPERARARPSAPERAQPAPPPAPQEVAVFLDRKQQLKTRFGTYPIFIHDHGSETISVSISYGPYTRVTKVLGTDSRRDNRTLIYADGRAQLYYINTPRAPQNCCLIEVVAAP